MTPRNCIYPTYPNNFSSVVKIMSELGMMRVWQLKDALQGRGLPVSGNKILLVSRLEDAMTKEAAVDTYLREELEEEQEAFEWLQNQELHRKREERESRDLEEMEVEVGNGTAKQRIDQKRANFKKLRYKVEKDRSELTKLVAKIKPFAKQRIDQEKAALKKLREKDEQDRRELVKLAAKIKARNKVILDKEEALKRKKTAADLFNIAFN